MPSAHQQLENLINNLSQCESNHHTATTQNLIVNFIHSSQSQKLIQYMNIVMLKVNQFNCCHIFANLFSDLSFTERHLQEIVTFLGDQMILCDGGNQHQQQQTNNHITKKLLIMEILFNQTIKHQHLFNKTLLTILIQTKCRDDLVFCYQFLFSINNVLSKSSVQERERLNINEISMLTIRVVKNWSKLPDYLVDQALKFINVLLIPKLINSPQSITEAKQIMTLLLSYVTCIVQSQTHKVGNAFKFLGLYLSSYQKLGLQLKKQTYLNIVECCRRQVLKVFPNLQQLPINCLQNEIQKTLQYCNDTETQSEMEEQSSQHAKSTKNNNKLNLIKSIRAHLAIQLLKGLSSFLSSFFNNLTSSNPPFISQLIQSIQQNRTLIMFKKVFQMLSFCNNQQIFCNFIEVYCRTKQINQQLGISFNFNQEHLMKQLVRNCPTPVGELDERYSEREFDKSQLGNVFLCLEAIILKWIKQGRLSQLLDLIKQKVQKQYDQAFNSRQFQSAINTLTLIFKLTQKIDNHSQTQKTTQINTLSKDEVIEWIKALLNLNESCLPVHRKIVISKTYQLISEVYNIILPGNQHLQQVIENQLIVKSYPAKKQCLEKLILFCEKYGNTIFQEGYKNKIQVKRFVKQFKSILTQSQQRIQIEDQQNTNQPSSKDKILSTRFSHSTFRKYKILERMYKKIQQKQLLLKERIYLWTLIVRIHKMEPSINTLFSIQDVKKLFCQRQDILYARHLASEMVIDDKNTRQILKLQSQRLQKVINHFKQYPFFYHDELKTLAK